MAWTNPITFTVGAILTASQMNVNLRDNLNYFKGAASNVILTSETTTSTAYTNLATVGPAVTATTDVQALVWVLAEITNSGASNKSFMGFAVSGASTVAAQDNLSIWSQVVAGLDTQFGGSFLVTGLTPGSNIFTAKYKVSAGTGTYVTRSLGVLPL